MPRERVAAVRRCRAVLAAIASALSIAALTRAELGQESRGHGAEQSGAGGARLVNVPPCKGLHGTCCINGIFLLLFYLARLSYFFTIPSA